MDRLTICTFQCSINKTFVIEQSNINKYLKRHFCIPYINVSGKKDYRLISRSIELQKIDQIRIYFFIKDLRGQTKDVFDNQGNRTTHFCFVREFLNMIANQGKMKLKKKILNKILTAALCSGFAYYLQGLLSWKNRTQF